jgi:hypothetical protein
MKTFASLLLLVAVAGLQETGVLIGELKTKQHGVRGKVFAVDEKTILVKNFQYDGAGPDAFFWVGTSEAPGNEGYILAHPFAGKFYKYDDDNAPILKGRFDGTEDIKLTLPKDLNVTDLKWFSVWCRQFSVNFGDLIFPENFPSTRQPPRPSLQQRHTIFLLRWSTLATTSTTKTPLRTATSWPSPNTIRIMITTTTNTNDSSRDETELQILIKMLNRQWKRPTTTTITTTTNTNGSSREETELQMFSRHLTSSSCRLYSTSSCDFFHSNDPP